MGPPLCFFAGSVCKSMRTTVRMASAVVLSVFCVYEASRRNFIFMESIDEKTYKIM